MKGSVFWLRHIQEYITTIVHVLEPATTNTSFTGMAIDISLKHGQMLPCRTYELRFEKEVDAIAFAVYYENRFRAAVAVQGSFTMAVNVIHKKDVGEHTVCIRFTPKQKGQKS